MKTMRTTWACLLVGATTAVTLFLWGASRYRAEPQQEATKIQGSAAANGGEASTLRAATALPPALPHGSPQQQAVPASALPLQHEPDVAADATHTTERILALAHDYNRTLTTVGTAEHRQRLFESIRADPSTHSMVLTLTRDLDQTIKAFGDSQAEARAFFGDYLQYLGEQQDTGELITILRDISMEITKEGDRKGRRLDLEDAFIGWLSSFDSKALLSEPERLLSQLAMTAEGWRIARLVLAEHNPEIWDSEPLRQRVLNTIRERTIP